MKKGRLTKQAYAYIKREKENRQYRQVEANVYIK